MVASLIARIKDLGTAETVALLSLITTLFTIIILRMRYRLVMAIGASMEPTISHGEIVLIRTAPDRIRVGDVVVFWLPDQTSGSDQLLIKRVIAVGGDHVDMSPRSLSPARFAPDADAQHRLIPHGYVFVASDSGFGYDSHAFGSVPLSSIVGVACG